VRPGAESLLRISGWPKVEKVLQAIDAIEALGIDPAELSSFASIARPPRASRAIRSTAPLRPIAARGSSPTAPLRMRSGYRSQRMTRPISRCPRRQGSMLWTSDQRCAIRSTTLPRHHLLHRMIVSAPGRALSSRPSPGGSTLHQVMMQQEAHLQSTCKSLTSRVHVRDSFCRMPTICLYPGQRNGARHDRNDGVSQHIA